MKTNVYSNPIINADYSDPDVVRVGDTYYMTASSFNYTPGLPILVSKDLVHWELKNYAIKNIDYPRYEKPAHARGVWAPAIRYQDGFFWIFYGMPDEGIFMVKAKDPLGQWTAPHCLLPGKGYIDPCPYWEGDQAYIVHGYAKSRIGFKSILGIFEMARDGRKALSEDVFLFDGTTSQVTIEGPKVYKRNHYYYIFAPAGGVTHGWQTVLRSKNLMGPYEERKVLAQGKTAVNGPHQGGWVDTPDGSHWFIHFQDRGIYGRVVHLQPMKWINDWPVMGRDGEPVMSYGLPLSQENPTTNLASSDDFSESKLGLQWQWFGNHKATFYRLDAKEKKLHLYCMNGPNLWETPNILTQKLIYDAFDVQVAMDFRQLGKGAAAGLVVMGGQYTYVAVERDVNGFRLVHGYSTGEGDSRTENICETVTLSDDLAQIYLKLSLRCPDGKPVIQMAYECENHKKTFDTLFEPSDHTWVGSKIGLYAIGESGEAIVDFVKVVDHD